MDTSEIEIVQEIISSEIKQIEQIEDASELMSFLNKSLIYQIII
jgi:hypothetical protein